MPRRSRHEPIDDISDSLECCFDDFLCYCETLLTRYLLIFSFGIGSVLLAIYHILNVVFNRSRSSANLNVDSQSAGCQNYGNRSKSTLKHNASGSKTRGIIPQNTHKSKTILKDPESKSNDCFCKGKNVEKKRDSNNNICFKRNENGLKNNDSFINDKKLGQCNKKDGFMENKICSSGKVGDDSSSLDKECKYKINKKESTEELKNNLMQLKEKEVILIEDKKTTNKLNEKHSTETIGTICGSRNKLNKEIKNNTQQTESDGNQTNINNLIANKLTDLKKMFFSPVCQQKSGKHKCFHPEPKKTGIGYHPNCPALDSVSFFRNQRRCCKTCCGSKKKGFSSNEEN